jgi:hypothetical protein
MSSTQRVTLRSQKTTAYAPDASGTVRVPIRRFWLLWRMLSAVLALLISGYALVMQGIHYGDAAPNVDLAAIAKEKFSGNASTDTKRLFDEATRYSTTVQNVFFRRWPIWSFGITAFVLLMASRALFLEFGRLQSDEPGLIASPRALTVNIDVKRRALKPIPWTAISAVELRRTEGLQGVTIRLREPGHVMYEGFFASRLPNTGRTSVTISPLNLAMTGKELKQLLDGYIATYATSSTLKRPT